MEEFETGMYDRRESAEAAIDRLYALGYTGKEISVMMSDKTREKHFAHETGTSNATKGAVTGAALGGALGTIVAGLTATGSVAAIVGTAGAATPLVAGPLAAALAGLGAGGAAGGVVGALIGAGIPDHKAKQYEERLNNGGILVGVKPRAEHRHQVRDIFLEDEPVELRR